MVFIKKHHFDCVLLKNNKLFVVVYDDCFTNNSYNKHDFVTFTYDFHKITHHFDSCYVKKTKKYYLNLKSFQKKLNQFQSTRKQISI